MSAKKYSPAAILLRNSRLMAMPGPLPPAPTHNIYSPPPAPHPTRQAIMTPAASAHRGDWGLKRDLPLSVSRSTQYMRYNDIDTPEHMTTFESAHDDVYTLKKWQEMDIGISKDAGLDDYKSMTKVFSGKTTVFNSETTAEMYKWRYEGPYLADMTSGEMREYITTRVKPRQTEFYKFVAGKQTADRLRKDYTASGMNISEVELQAQVEEKSDCHEVDILELRADQNYLEKLVYEFLDIPVQGRPHRTHPSAGLYYTRSSARAINDPLNGPQQLRNSIPGRELNHNKDLNTKMVGIGGVVARLSKTAYGSRGQSTTRFEVNKYIPLKAVINPAGKIQMDVDQIKPEAAYGGGGLERRSAMGSFLGNKQNKSWGGPPGENKEQYTDSIVAMLAKYSKKKE